MDLYSKLGITKTATKKEIKTAFKKLSSKHHPDKGGNAEDFKEIQHAYSVLSDERKRAHYDKTGSDKGGINPDNVLLQAFAAIISEGAFNGDIVEKIIASLSIKIKHVKLKNFDLDRNICELTKQKGRISTEKENLFELILNESIQNLTNKIYSNEESIEEFESLKESLKNYTDTRPENERRNGLGGIFANTY